MRYIYLRVSQQTDNYSFALVGCKERIFYRAINGHAWFRKHLKVFRVEDGDQKVFERLWQVAVTFEI